jgi:hypothetical protein
MTIRKGFVWDFVSQIVDQTIAGRSAQWAKDRFQNGFTLSFDDQRWIPVRAWEQDGAMSCGIRFFDEDGNVIPGLDVTIGWPGVTLPAKTNGDGWVDVPINGGNYPGGSAGPMFIHVNGGSLSYDGLGWRDATNHSHLNLDVKRGKFTGTGPLPPTQPDPPPTGPQPPSGADLESFRVWARQVIKEEVRIFLAPVVAAWKRLIE